MSDTAVLERIDELEARLMTLPVPENFGISFLAKKRGVSAGYLRDHPHLLPKFGVTEVPGKYLWSLSTIREWLEASLSDIDSTWDHMSNVSRRAILARRCALK